MWNRAYYKETGRAVFLNNYWPAVGVSLLLTLLAGDNITVRINDLSETLIDFTQMVHGPWSDHTMDLIYVLEHYSSLLAPFAISLGMGSVVIQLLVTNPFEVGVNRFFLESSPTQSVPFSRVAFGFSANYGNVILTRFLQSLYTCLWTLLFIVPGIIRSFGYFAVPFLLAENPNLHHSRAIQLSLDMTQGYKWDIFVTLLSFIGWQILSGLTFGILGVFYVNPYYYATRAEMYRALRKNALEKGIATAEELSGVTPPYTERRELP